VNSSLLYTLFSSLTHYTHIYNIATMDNKTPAKPQLDHDVKPGPEIALLNHESPQTALGMFADYMMGRPTKKVKLTHENVELKLEHDAGSVEPHTTKEEDQNVKTEDFDKDAKTSAHE